MADIDKVIKGLEHCRLMCEGVSHNPCNGCPHQGSIDCADKLKTDALELLKEKQILDYNQGFTDGYQQAIREANNMERVTLCKDCKHFIRILAGWYCENLEVAGKLDPNWFCADGERRSSENDE